MKKMICAGLIALLPGLALAYPLQLQYSITNLDAGQYRYDFKLSVDGTDGSWKPGQQFDWIVFGDRQGSYGAPSGFCPVDCWTSKIIPNITGLDEGFTGNTSGGGHQGPMLSYGPSGPVLPGWQPADAGAFTDWSYLSDIYLPQGQLYFSALVRSDWTIPDGFYLAQQVGAKVPEPSSIALAGLALSGLILQRRRRR
jgi:hypothetical protein